MVNCYIEFKLERINSLEHMQAEHPDFGWIEKDIRSLRQEIKWDKEIQNG